MSEITTKRTFVRYCGGALVGAAVWGAVSLVSLADMTSLPWHHSGDFRAFYIYLARHIAISKSISVDAKGDYSAFFIIGRARFLGSPELASLTGDEMEATIAPFP